MKRWEKIKNQTTQVRTDRVLVSPVDVDPERVHERATPAGIHEDALEVAGGGGDDAGAGGAVFEHPG